MGKATTQTVAAAGQFTGGVGAGLFAFASDGIPATHRVVVHRVAYSTAVGAAGNIKIVFRRPGGAATDEALIGEEIEANLTGWDGAGAVSYCGGVVPRDGSGAFWEVVAVTSGKAVDGTVVVDWSIEAVT